MLGPYDGEDMRIIFYTIIKSEYIIKSRCDELRDSPLMANTAI